MEYFTIGNYLDSDREFAVSEKLYFSFYQNVTEGKFAIIEVRERFDDQGRLKPVWVITKIFIEIYPLEC